MSRNSLQVRLVAVIALVLVVVIAAVGATTVSVQNANLRSRLDGQLRTAMSMALGVPPSPGAGIAGAEVPGAGELEGPPGPRFGALDVTILGGQTLRAQAVTAGGEVVALDNAVVQDLVDHAEFGAPYSQHVPGLGSYRLLATEVTTEPGPSTGPTAGVVIVGQSLAELQRTTRSLIGVFALTGLIGVVAASALGAALVRATLRPLRSLQQAAATVSETPLASGSVTLPPRVPVQHAPGSEVAELAQSFNQMMDHVEASLQRRESSEEKLKKFAADASHELRTPLATVSGYAEFAARQEDALPQDVAHSLARIRSEAGRMGGIVEDLLMLARLDSGHTTRGHSAVMPVVLDCLTDAQMADGDHIWRLQIADDLGDLRVGMAEGPLRQSLTNLLSNARLHTPAGTTVTVRICQPSEAECLIKVEDDGPGLPPDLLAQVFDRFVRGDAARSALAEGEKRSTGLGLAITEQLVKNAGGSVTAESRPGVTTFSLRLPVLPTN